MKKVLSKVFGVVALLLTIAESGYASADQDVVVCMVARNSTIEKAMYFAKTNKISAAHFVEYERNGKIYELSTTEENSKQFKGLRSARLDVWLSHEKPDVSNADNLRFLGTAAYINSTGQQAIRIQNPVQGLTIQCEETSSGYLSKAYPGIDLVLVP